MIQQDKQPSLDMIQFQSYSIRLAEVIMAGSHGKVVSCVLGSLLIKDTDDMNCQAI